MPTEKVYDVANLGYSHLICLGWVPQGSRVLEFGPATGYLTRAMRDDLGCKVTGFESSREAAAKAARYCDRILVGDIENPEAWRELDPPYTVAIFLDVLEHLHEPWLALRRCREMLAPDALLIVSVPNIVHWTIRRELLRGRFDYSERGILDNTHLRFFTRKTLLDMLIECGFEPIVVEATPAPYPGDRFCHRIGLSWPKRHMNNLATWLFPNVFAYQYLVQCRLAPTAPNSVPAAGDLAKVEAEERKNLSGQRLG